MYLNALYSDETPDIIHKIFIKMIKLQSIWQKLSTYLINEIAYCHWFLCLSRLPNNPICLLLGFRLNLDAICFSLPQVEVLPLETLLVAAKCRSLPEVIELPRVLFLVITWCCSLPQFAWCLHEGINIKAQYIILQLITNRFIRAFFNICLAKLIKFCFKTTIFHSHVAFLLLS